MKRVPEPEGARGRIVEFTPAGLRALGDANRVKRRIEREYEAIVGRVALAALKSALAQIADFG